MKDTKGWSPGLWGGDGGFEVWEARVMAMGDLGGEKERQ